MLQPALTFLPVPIAAATAHSIAVAIAFAIVTALHIVLGELAPKTIALDKAGSDRAHRRQADRAVHEGLLAVHPRAERHRPRRWSGCSASGARAATRWCTRKTS